MPQRDRYISQELEKTENVKQKIDYIYKTGNLYDVNITNQYPKVGEIWYVRIRDNTTLSTMKVKDLSEKTVLLISTTDEACMKSGYRYSLTDIEFVEKAK